jgi:hypothetical protein
MTVKTKMELRNKRASRRFCEHALEIWWSWSDSWENFIEPALHSRVSMSYTEMILVSTVINCNHSSLILIVSVLKIFSI